MAWPGYFTFAGQEIINASRTEAYAAHAGVGWFKPVYKNQALPLILGETYISPLQDDAPWTDPDALASYDFLGAYPLDVTGIEDSTVSATVVESTRNGGVVQAPRHGTRTIVFSAALVGLSPASMDHGIMWLEQVLNQCGCSRPQTNSGVVCGGEELHWLSSEPAVDLNYTQGVATYDRTVVDGDSQAGWPTPIVVNGGSAVAPGGQLVNGGGVESSTTVSTAPTFDLTECLDPYRRTAYKVTTTTGPTVVQKLEMPQGGVVWIVEWTLVAGDPNRYAAPFPVVVGFLDPEVDVPYPGDTVPPGAFWDPNGYVTKDPPCPVEVFQPVFDPACPLLIPPPAVPTISPVCFTFPTNFRRRQFTIPKQDVPLWMGTVPIITIHTPANSEVRNLRVRFYGDDDFDVSVDDACDPEGDVVFTYLPPNSVVTFDGTLHMIYVDTPGQGRRRADSIATDSDGGPFAWPELSCAAGYVVTVDMPQTQHVPVVDLTLVKKAC